MIEEYHAYNIDTGYIYTELGILEDIMPRSFFSDFENKLEELIWNKPVRTVSLPIGEPYTNEKLEENDRNQEFQNDLKHRPYTWFFIKPSNIVDGYELVPFENPYVVERVEDDLYFDYFFSVKFRLMDMMKIREFLFFQLEKSFEMDLNLFENFLHDLLIKYKEFLCDGKRDVITKSVLDEMRRGSIKISAEEYTEIEEAILAIKVLAFHYLLKLIDPDLIENRKGAAEARFLKTLTGQNYSNIYKIVLNPLSKPNGNLRLEEMEIVRKHFEDLGLESAVELILKDFKH